MSIKFTDRMCYLFKVTVVCSLLSLLYSCVKTANKTDYENLKRISAEVQIPVSLICKDTLVVDARETSMQGYWKVIDNQLCFTDEHIVRVIIYDTLGKKLNSIFMQGRGPREFTSPALSFFQLSNGKYLYADKNQNLYILSSSPEYTKEVHTNVITAGLPKKNVDNFINDLLANPDPNNYAMYELCFQGYDFIEYNDDILFPVSTDHVSFNGYFSKYAKDFYSQSFTIMAVDKKNLMISDLLCKFPPIYHNKVIPNFKKCHLAACEDLLYVSFEAESKIYVLNESYELLGFFGEGEDAINSDFPETSSLDEALKTSSKHRKMCGHYGRISYAGEYLFREFFLPDNNKGIQIYKNHMLVHTLYQIDKDFTIIGYINPYYYAFSGYDMENERFNIVRLQIK